MTPETRHADQRWQLEHKIAELVSEQKVIGFTIQQQTARLYEVNREISQLQSQLAHGEPS